MGTQKFTDETVVPGTLIMCVSTLIPQAHSYRFAKAKANNRGNIYYQITQIS